MVVYVLCVCAHKRVHVGLNTVGELVRVNVDEEEGDEEDEEEEQANE